MDKLVELLGKIFKAVFSAQVLWLLVIAVAILSVALILLASGPLAGNSFVQDNLDYIQIAALASLALILAKGLLWILGRIREQYFT